MSCRARADQPHRPRRGERPRRRGRSRMVALRALSDADYQACAKGHQGAGVFADEQGARHGQRRVDRRQPDRPALPRRQSEPLPRRMYSSKSRVYLFISSPSPPPCGGRSSSARRRTPPRSSPARSRSAFRRASPPTSHASSERVPGACGLTALHGVDRRGREGLHARLVQPPRYIYASTADRRSGRRWSRRRRTVPAWMLAGGVCAALLAGELLRVAG
jgi:hypothetical protein